MNIETALTPIVSHVKWFSDFDFRDPPRFFGEILNPLFWFFLILATVVIGALPVVERWLTTIKAYDNIDNWLRDKTPLTGRIMNYSIAAVLLLNWADHTLLAPEIYEESAIIGWSQFFIAILLLTGRANRVAALAIGALWFVGVFLNGAFHMFDYFHLVGIAAFIYFSQDPDLKRRELGIPALYFSVGFSLVWLGLEKLVYAGWSLSLLEQRPVLRLGMPPDFFLTGAAFVEIALGVLLILGLLGRPFALVITVVFIMTTLVFGRSEVIGHTSLHASLVVFLIHGSGTVYRPPFALVKKLWQQMLLAGVTLVGLIFGLGSLYVLGAQYEHKVAIEKLGPIPDPIVLEEKRPVLKSVEVVKTVAGTDVVVNITNWEFVEPLLAGETKENPVHGRGYGVISVDGRSIVLIAGKRSPIVMNTERVLDKGVLRLYSQDGRLIVDDEGDPVLFRLSELDS